MFMPVCSACILDKSRSPCFNHARLSRMALPALRIRSKGMALSLHTRLFAPDKRLVLEYAQSPHVQTGPGFGSWWFWRCIWEVGQASAGAHIASTESSVTQPLRPYSRLHPPDEDRTSRSRFPLNFLPKPHVGELYLLEQDRRMEKGDGNLWRNPYTYPLAAKTLVTLAGWMG
ncbi:hypothetical protein EJ04DRAFT_299433 [Polyplosphaeria fusca]|uniref:Uncharacterized protein n=1 Tax=Polyplosphaeria fusca TaxID=682080 RepID=A0A9P4V254_9PLEO|nr:hypothetical protein EJ04DRAFT_299433 [Polyplosphaeria fusca]